MSEIDDNYKIGHISTEPLRRAISDRYLTYALSTIMHRALPDARDGLSMMPWLDWHKILMSDIR